MNILLLSILQLYYLTKSPIMASLLVDHTKITSEVSYNIIGMQLVTQKNFIDAIVKFDECINLFPKSYIAYHNKSVVLLLHIKDAKMALESNNIAFDINSDDLDIMLCRILILRNLKKYEEAYTLCITLTKKYPDNILVSYVFLKINSDIYDNYINIFSKTGRLHLRSILHYLQIDQTVKKLIDAKTVNVDTYNNCAIAMYSIGGYSKSIELLSKALELDDKNSEAYYYRALAGQHIKTPYLVKVTTDFEMAINLDPNEFYYLITYIKFLIKHVKQVPDTINKESVEATDTTVSNTVFNVSSEKIAEVMQSLIVLANENKSYLEYIKILCEENLNNESLQKLFIMNLSNVLKKIIRIEMQEETDKAHEDAITLATSTLIPRDDEALSCYSNKSPFTILDNTDVVTLYSFTCQSVTSSKIS